MLLVGYPAIVFQHEYDHLDGILYTSKMYKKEDLDPSIEPLYELNNEDGKDEA
jgi:peptide deformylase